MGLFDRLFGRKKEKKEDIREEELVQTEASETEDAIEELENENQSQVENAPEESSQEEIIPFEEEDKQEFYEELEERLSEDQVLNEVIEDKTQNRFVEQEADELQQEETEESVSIAEKSEEAQIDNSSEEELAEESVPVQEGSEEKQSELDSETPALEDIKLEDQGPLTVDEPGQADEDAKDSNQAEAVEEEKQDFLERISIFDESPRSDDIPALIMDQYMRTVRREYRKSVFQRLEGWWTDAVIKQLTETNPKELFGYEVSDMLSKFADEYTEENLPITLRRAGANLYNWAQFETGKSESLRIRARVTEPYVLRGSFHILADVKPKPRVYWHPRFLDRLSKILEVTP